MTRIWWKDQTYTDVPSDQAHEYETQPDFDRSEEITSAPPMIGFVPVADS